MSKINLDVDRVRVWTSDAQRLREIGYSVVERDGFMIVSSRGATTVWETMTDADVLRAAADAILDGNIEGMEGIACGLSAVQYAENGAYWYSEVWGRHVDTCPEWFSRLQRACYAALDGVRELDREGVAMDLLQLADIVEAAS